MRLLGCGGAGEPTRHGIAQWRHIGRPDFGDAGDRDLLRPRAAVGSAARWPAALCQDANLTPSAGITTTGGTEMAEILGLGCTHWPTLCLPNERLTDVFHRVLNAPNVDPKVKDPANWPAELLAELGNDNGLGAAQRCGERFGNDFRAVRKILDDFNPDFVLVWGDDQYENFKEDIVPPFCVLGYDQEFDLQPWQVANGSNGAGKPNRWSEPRDWTLPLKGHREAAKFLATGLIERRIDLAYAYKPLHHPMAHAFTNTFLYLDWDRKRFPYPVVPFGINCYGRNLTHSKVDLC